MDAFGADRLVPGSDYPVLTIHEPYRDTIDWIRHSGLADDTVDQILNRNAPGLFGIES